MRCLYAASEVAGFAKTGGLADVAAALPRALAERGLDCAVVMPLYRSACKGKIPLQPTSLHFNVSIRDRRVRGELFRATLPGCNVPVFLINQPDYFDRDDPAHGKGLYQHTLVDGKKGDYPDNCERFIFFSRAVLEILPLLDFWPDVLHCNDWQTGLVPVYVSELHGRQPGPLRQRYRKIRTLFTLHNMAYQGVFWHLDMPLTGLPWKIFNPEQLEFYGHINFLKGGIVFADAVTTVSPMYSREIQTPYYGCGLQGVLARRSRRVHGIVNGVDYQIWNPACDSFLESNYNEKSLGKGKAACKAALQKYFNLSVKAKTPLLGIVSRLVDQKGFDLVGKAAPTLLKDDVQLVILGEGELAYHTMLADLQKRHPAKFGLRLAQDEKLAHQIEAGADIFLMPSQFEPCGLNQLYSLKYGTIPVVRATGGLADTVVDTNPGNLAAGTATGFVFLAYTPEAFLETVHRAVKIFREDPKTWRTLQETGMKQDWSWNRSAGAYENLYRSLAEEDSHDP